MNITRSINPYNGEEIAAYENHTTCEVENFIDNADKAFYHWRETPFAYRSKLMMAAAAELRMNAVAYAETIVAEVGKPIAQALAEVKKCAWVCEYYAENAEQHLASEYIETDADRSYIRYEPLGVILAVMPWNYPFWQVFRFAAPALMAGNVAVLKHASNVFGSALNIEKVFRRAGFPEHSFTTLLVGSNRVASIVENKKIKAATLTGSGPAGAAVAALAGQQIKKTVLELGGNNALIVLNDCDLDKTVDTCVQARFQNTGQSCIAGKRVLVQSEIADAFTEKLLEKVRVLKAGDPMDENTFIGAMAREDLAEELEDQLKASLAEGAQLLIGGKRNKTFFEPTILANVTPDMTVFNEETFGPLLSITTFETVTEAIELSNASKFGLGVSIFTQDIDAIEKLVYQFDEGAVFINELVKSDPRLPFGGIKESGYGRELGRFGIREFVNQKTVFVAK